MTSTRFDYLPKFVDEAARHSCTRVKHLKPTPATHAGMSASVHYHLFDFISAMRDRDEDPNSSGGESDNGIGGGGGGSGGGGSDDMDTKRRRRLELNRKVRNCCCPRL